MSEMGWFAKHAVAWGSRGVLFFAGALVALALFLAWVVANPYQQAADHVVSPVAHDIGIVGSRCHSGWEDVSGGELHTPVFICAKGDWRVHLKPDGKTFEYAVELNNPQAKFIMDEALVPGW